MKKLRGNEVKQEEQTSATPVGIVRELNAKQLKFVFEGCTLDQLEFFMEKAIEQEEYELCIQFKRVLDENLLAA
jgi:hypothetical protein